MLKLGTQKISAVYLGGEKIIRGLVGVDVVFELVKPVTAYTISAVLNLPDGGTVTGGGTYLAGETVTLSYTAAEDYRFTGWYAGSTLLSKENPYTFMAMQDMDITARCEEIPTYTITFTPTGINAQNGGFRIIINDTGGPSWSWSGANPSSPPAISARDIKEGNVKVYVTDCDGYEFAGWQIGSGGVVTDNPYTFNLTSDITMYVKFKKASRLPEGYTEVEYIQSDAAGKCSIDTGYPLKFSESRIVLDIERIKAVGGSERFLGTYTSPTPYWYAWITTANNINARLSTDSASAAFGAIALNKRIIIDVNFYVGTFTKDGASYALGKTSATSGSHLFLFSNSNTSYAAPCPYMKLYSAKVYNGTTLFQDFVPCKNISGVVGLYDLVHGVFYKNSGTGAMTAGPAV